MTVLARFMGSVRAALAAAATRRFTVAHVSAALVVFIALLWLVWHRCGILGCPSVEQLCAYQPGGGAAVLDRDGAQFAILTPVEHSVVRLEDLPAYVPAAFVAVEDKRFFEHAGIDYRRVAGALVANMRARSVTQGFSTIAMQLARNIWPERLPGRQRTLKRKLFEIRVALEIERKFSKQEILELYLNHIYFGEGAYGIDAAARTYFGHAARRLSLSEAAALAALPKSPSAYDPRRYPERATLRRNLVLDMMAAQGRVDPAQIRSARAAHLNVRREPPPDARKPAFAPYFLEAVRREMEDRFGEDLYGTPLRIHTTLDRRAQSAAEQQLARQLRAIEGGQYGRFRGTRYSSALEAGSDPEYLQGAMLLMQAQTGDVLALVGGRDFQQSRFDRATHALRQPGSAFKPFVFAVALHKGYAPSQHIADTPLQMKLQGGELWEPRNFRGGFAGQVSVREALVHSKNVPTARLALAVGIPDVIRLARRAGIRSAIPDRPSMALGTGSVSVLELTAAYTAFATLGDASAPRNVTSVEDAEGNVLWKNDVHRRHVMQPAEAFVLTNMLMDAVNRGTGVAVRHTGYVGPAAGKTGTTNNATDVWFVGYTPDVVGTVWMGFDKPKPILADATGGKLAAPVWGRVMRDATPNRAQPGWAAPPEITHALVDPASGLLLEKGCRPKRGQALREVFVSGREPLSVCPRGATEPGSDTLTAIGDWSKDKITRSRKWMAKQLRRIE